MQQQGHLIIHGQGEVEVSHITRYLTDLNSAYESVLVFESIIARMRRTVQELPAPLRMYPFALMLEWSLPRRRGGQFVQAWPPNTEEISLLVPISDRLVLSATKLESPGFWEFLGKLNPLEVLRQYLNDRHERRKDLRYRESAEERRLRLENMLLENKVLRERIEIAHQLGMTKNDLAPLLNRLIHSPLTALDSHQDHGVIEHAELKQGEQHDDNKKT